MTLTASQGLDPIVFIVNSDQVTREWIESIVSSAGLRASSLSRASELTASLTPGAVACAILDVTVPCDADQLASVLRDAVQEARSSVNRRVQMRELCSRYELLTAREREVFELVTDGLPNKQVARRLEISEITVQIHRSRVMRKMSAPSFASLVRMADALHALCGPRSN